MSHDVSLLNVVASLLREIRCAADLGAAWVAGVVVDYKSFVPASLRVVAQQERWSVEVAHHGTRCQWQRVVFVRPVNVCHEQRRVAFNDRRSFQVAQLIRRHHGKSNVRQDFWQTLVVNVAWVVWRFQPTHDRLHNVNEITQLGLQHSLTSRRYTGFTARPTATTTTTPRLLKRKKVESQINKGPAIR